MVENGLPVLPENDLQTGESLEEQNNGETPINLEDDLHNFHQNIVALAPVKNPIDFKSKVVAADLEALILPDGTNKVYMASWYNGQIHNTFDIKQFNYNTQTMLEQFWIDLINHNQGRTVYFIFPLSRLRLPSERSSGEERVE